MIKIHSFTEKDLVTKHKYVYEIDVSNLNNLNYIKYVRLNDIFPIDFKIIKNNLNSKVLIELKDGITIKAFDILIKNRESFIVTFFYK